MEPRIQAIEWMNLKPKAGGFVFNPDKPARSIEVKGQQVYSKEDPPEATKAANTAKATVPAKTQQQINNEVTAKPAITQPKFLETTKQDDLHLEVTLNGAT